MPVKQLLLDETNQSTAPARASVQRRAADDQASHGPHEELLRLQRLAGNQAVTSVIQRLRPAYPPRPAGEEREDILNRNRSAEEEDDEQEDEAEEDTTSEVEDDVDEASEPDKPDYPARPVGEDRQRIIHQGHKPDKPKSMSATTRLEKLEGVGSEDFLQNAAVKVSKEIRLGPKKREATAKSRFQAAKFLQIAHQSQEKITSDVEAAMAPGGGKRAGAEFVNKDWAGLADKMAMPENQAKMGKDFLGSVGDALRFTIIFAIENFTDNVLGVFDFLGGRGYQAIKVFNTFKDETASYRGVNTNWRAGNGIKWELQFHTPESYEVKTHVNHEPYEGARNAQEGDARADLLETRMKKVSARIKTPAGIERIQDVGGRK